MKVGIAALGSNVGSGGGVDIYTRYLVEALAELDPGNTYVVLLTQYAELAATKPIEGWKYRRWPDHIRFVTLRDQEPRQPIQVRVLRRLRRSLRLPTPPREGEQYLARQIDRLGLDLVHYPRSTVFTLSIKTKCLLTLFDIQHEYYPEFFTTDELERRTRLYRLSVDKAARVVVPSQYTKLTLTEKYATPADKVSVIPVGIADSFGRAKEAEVERVRAKYSLPQEFIYYPANPWPHKNHARLMAALRIYRESFGSPPPLVLSGRLQGDHLDALGLARAEGVDDSVIDLGYVLREESPALYSAATVMVFPSLFEGFGIPIIEAMACGCPIVAANATAMPDCAGNAAVYCDPCNPDSIAEALRSVCINADLRCELAERGFQRIHQFRWPNIVPQIVATYRAVAGHIG